MHARAKAGIVLPLTLGIAWATAAELDVSPRRQGIPDWSWAAATAMVVDYATGAVTRDCQVVAAYDRLLGGPGMCCELAAACMRSGVAQEIAYVAASVYGVSGRHLPRPLTFPEIVAEIARGWPVVAALRKGGRDHAVVVSGHDGSGQVTLIDPLRGTVRVDYEQLRNDPIFGSWRDSVTFSAQPPPQQGPSDEASSEVGDVPAPDLEPFSAPPFPVPPRDAPPASQLLFPIEPICTLC